MPSIRTFPAALATACAILIAPAAAQASGWTEVDVLSASGAPISQLSDASANNRIAAAPDGSVTVAWIQNNGSNDKLYARHFSARTGSWSAIQEVSTAAENLYTAGLVMDSDGNTSAFWVLGDFSSVKTSTLFADDADWSEPHTIASGGVQGFGSAAGPNGTVTVALIQPDGGNHVLNVYSRNRNSAAWDAPTPVAHDGAQLSPAITIDYNRHGDGVMLFSGSVSGTRNAYLSRYNKDSETWSATPTTVFANVASGFTGMQDVTLAGNGHAAVVIDPDDFQPVARIVRADDTLTGTQALGGGFSVIPQVASDEQGRFVSSWQALDLGTGEVTGWFSVADAETGTWAAPSYLPEGQQGSAIDLLGNDNGQIRLLMAFGLDLSSMQNYQLGTVTWSADTASWSAVEPVEGSSATTYNTFASTGYGHSPVAAISSTGDVFAAWSQNLPGSTWGIGFAANDATGPQLTAVSIPDAGVADTALSFSASASDVWSEIGSTDWQFGDGTTASGASASHTYGEAGTYTVTVTATDTSGNTTSQTRQITIAPAPAEPEEKPEPPVLAPVIEARLTGKTITFNAKVTLRAGKKCTGKATATTKFGNTTYRSTLKLRKVNGTCVGTGTIKLKKAPSTRTRLRVTVSAKTIKTRTLTPKRG